MQRFHVCCASNSPIWQAWVRCRRRLRTLLLSLRSRCAWRTASLCGWMPWYLALKELQKKKCQGGVSGKRNNLDCKATALSKHRCLPSQTLCLIVEMHFFYSSKVLSIRNSMICIAHTSHFLFINLLALYITRNSMIIRTMTAFAAAATTSPDVASHSPQYSVICSRTNF